MPATQEERRLANSLARLTLLYEVGRSLSSLVDLDQLIDGIVAAAAEVMQARASSLMLLDRNGQDLVFAVAVGEKGAQLRGLRVPMDGRSIASQVAQTGAALVADDVHSVPYFSGQMDQTTAFETRSILCVPLRGKAGILGVIEVLNKISGERFTDDDVSLLTALAGSAAVAIENARLYSETVQRAAELAEMVAEMQRTYRGTLHALTALLDARDSSTQGHSQRVVHFTLALARATGITDRAELERIHYGALLHDVGKIGVPDEVLYKPGSYTPAEWAEMHRHPEIGFRMLRDIDFLQQALPIVLYHHEHWDGTGYPHGLAGEAIPLAARIFAVTDAYDALTSVRPYKPAYPHEHAVERILAARGTHFDPRIVDAFLTIPREEWERLRALPTGGSQTPPNAGPAQIMRFL